MLQQKRICPKYFELWKSKILWTWEVASGMELDQYTQLFRLGIKRKHSFIVESHAIKGEEKFADSFEDPLIAESSDLDSDYASSGGTDGE